MITSNSVIIFTYKRGGIVIMNHADEIQLERLASPKIKELIDGGMKTAIVPAGAIEQHGAHLPLLVDAAHATWQGAEVAKRMGNALVAPTIRVGSSEHHTKFPGTVSLRKSTFESICEDYCISLKQHGFDTICFFSCHGGNFRILGDMETRLNSLVDQGTKVITFSDLNLLIQTWRETAEIWSGFGDRAGGHAGIAETSFTLSLHPELVHQDEIEPGYSGDILHHETQKTLFDGGIHNLAYNGIIGDPTGANEELGELCLKAYAKVLVQYFRSRMLEKQEGI